MYSETMTYRLRWSSPGISAALAVALWCALAYSVGWYHTLTRLGAKGYPLPSPETAIVHTAYFTALSRIDVSYETAWWFAVFVLVGVVWVGLLVMTAPFFGGQKAGFARALRNFALASLPLACMGPVVAWYVWERRGKFLYDEIYLRVVEFGLVEPEPWLGPAYMGLAGVSLLAQFYVHVKTFGIRPASTVIHFVLVWMLTLAAVVGAAHLLLEGADDFL